MKFLREVTLIMLTSLFCIFSTKAIALKPEHYTVVEKFIEVVKSNDKAKISNFIIYPLRRAYPIPSIKNKHEFIERFDEIFDSNLLKMISASNRLEWDDVGDRGIMLGNGELWLDFNGELKAINYQSATEKNIKNKIIETDKNKLHHSLRNFVVSALKFQTKNFKIRIDVLANGKYRYAAWNISKKTTEKPDLVLINGEIIFEGSGGNHDYIFKNGIYQYKCEVNYIGYDDVDYLLVYRDDKLILRDPVVADY